MSAELIMQYNAVRYFIIITEVLLRVVVQNENSAVKNYVQNFISDFQFSFSKLA